MLSRVHYLLRVIEIDVWMLEQSQAEFEFQYSSYRAIHKGHGNSAFLHTFNQRAHICGFVRNIQIDACAQRQSSSFFLRRNNPFVNEGPEPLSFTGDDALETKFLPQNISEPLLRGVDRNVFDIGITRHYRQRVVFCDRRNPGRQYVASQASFGQAHGAALEAAEGFALGWKICHQCYNFVRRIDLRTLRALYDRFRNARCEVRILRVCLFIAPHPGIPVQFQNQSRKCMDANRSRFTRCGAVYQMEEWHIKRAAEGETLGENRRTR